METPDARFGTKSIIPSLASLYLVSGIFKPGICFVIYIIGYLNKISFLRVLTRTVPHGRVSIYVSYR